MSNSVEISFDNLDYGAYALAYENGMYTENYRYASAEFNRLYVRSVRLPDGKSNIVYLLSNDFEKSLRMISGGSFIKPPTYRRLYYPWILMGSFMKIRYKMSVMKDRNERNKLMNSIAKLRPIPSRKLPSLAENIFFTISDIYKAIEPIMQRYPVKKNYEKFFSELSSILKGLTPEPTASDETKGSGRRILIIDTEAFKFKAGAPLKDNKTNPLFLLYLAYLRTRNLSNMGVDMDMMICGKNMFLKFNPAKLTRDKLQVFKRALFRIMNTNLDDYVTSLDDKEKDEVEDTMTDKTVSGIVKTAISPYTRNASVATQSTLADSVEKSFRKQVARVSVADTEIRKAQMDRQRDSVSSSNVPKPKTLMHLQPGIKPLTTAQRSIVKSIAGNYTPLSMNTGMEVDDEDEDIDDEEEDVEDETDEDVNVSEVEDDIRNDVNEILTTDEEVAMDVMEDIQNRTAPLDNPKTSPVNGARDRKLREAQKKIIVKGSSIEEIMAVEADNVPIQVTDKSKVMHVCNENMKQIKFNNFNKTYLDSLYTNDIVACFDNLKDKESPFYIKSIDIKDSSNTMNLKETWTVKLVDETGGKHTIKVDIPKFQNDRFMLLEGNKYIILPQNLYNPIVKDTPDTVIITTNYNKVFVWRKATKSLDVIERIFSLMKKVDDNKLFVTGDSSRSNMNYVSSLEYDEIASKIFKFSSKGCTIYFSRDYITNNLSADIPKNTKGDEFYIGSENGVPILINEDTGRDRLGRTISEIIEANLSDEHRAIYNSIKTPKQLMFAEGKMAGQELPMIVPLLTWVGLTKTLDAMDIKWTFHNDIKRAPMNNSESKYIKFADGILEYEAKTFAELLLNGLTPLHPEKLSFSDFDTEAGYSEFIYSKWGTYRGITEIKVFYEFLVDPITQNVCRTLKLPDEPVGLLIYAIKMLCSNECVSKVSDKSYRLRTIEAIPALLYKCIAIQYKAHVHGGRKLPMTLNQGAVISLLMKQPNVEAYSTLNPVVEMESMHTVSAKGYSGSNEVHAYDNEEKRSYDESSLGKIAMATPANNKVGVNRQLVAEPTISNARGFREQVDDVDELKDVNVFSPVELLTPGTARNDDPIRTAIAAKQSSHTVPVKDASPSLVSNGFDEAVQFYLSDDFVINADEDGEVIDVNDKLGFVMVKYKSGKTRAIYTKPEMVHNSGGGFYMSNKLLPTHTKVGEKFKKDEVLAYHDRYFTYSKMNGLRYAIGPIVKMAIMSSYNTYEDAGICTESLAGRMQSALVYQQTGAFKKNNNILHMVKVGDHVNIGDPLIKFDVSVEENELAKYLSKLSEENASVVEEETKNDIKATHAGTIVDIKVYTLLDPSNLSPSLGKIVQQYFNNGINKKKYLEKFDNSEGIMKAGYMLTDETKPLKDRYNRIKGRKGIDVLIEIYIEHPDVMGVGDKVALYGPNKQIISEVIPKGWEPYSEFRPDEEISVLTSPGTIARRMTPSIIPVSAAMKIMIEMKRKIQDIIKVRTGVVINRKEIEELIYNVFDALDPSGSNTMKYKNMFMVMNEGQFHKFFKEFLENDKENFILDIVEFEHDLNMDVCEKAAKVLGIPLMEYVYMPHLTMDKKHVVVSKEKCLVSYCTVKRTQQFLHKKNGMSVSNEKRSSLTGQVVFKDKNARDSDIEASLLVSLGADKILQELHGPRSDDHVMKRQMLQSISTKGYVVLDELDNVSTNKVTLNTVNTYLLTMGLKSDLVSDTYILPKTSSDLFE